MYRHSAEYMIQSTHNCNCQDNPCYLVVTLVWIEIVQRRHFLKTVKLLNLITLCIGTLRSVEINFVVYQKIANICLYVIYTIKIKFVITYCNGLFAYPGFLPRSFPSGNDEALKQFLLLLPPFCQNLYCKYIRQNLDKTSQTSLVSQTRKTSLTS